jgi:DNA polymerase-3 subunit epsilon
LPFDLKDSLKRRGYRWSDGSDGRARSWYVDVGEAALDDEIKFLKTEIYLRDVETRYPAALCEPCQASIRDRDGQSVQMFNEGFSGGLEIRTATGALTLPEAEKLPLFVRGIECRAREHRFGGVVVQPLEAWDAAG